MEKYKNVTYTKYQAHEKEWARQGKIWAGCKLILNVHNVTKVCCLTVLHTVSGIVVSC